MNAVTHYIQLAKRLRELRQQNPDVTPEETTLLDQLEEIWWDLSPAEQDAANKLVVEQANHDS
jgi:hypothetical protein